MLEQIVVGLITKAIAAVLIDPAKEAALGFYERRSLQREVERAADAASKTLVRFFQGEGIDLALVQQCAEAAQEAVRRSRIDADALAASALNVAHVAALLAETGVRPPDTREEVVERAYAMILESCANTLVRLAPAFKEWERAAYAHTSQALDEAVSSLESLHDKVDQLAAGLPRGQTDRFVDAYRRFVMTHHDKLEAGTLRMASTWPLDLRTLFVPPLGRSASASAAMGERTRCSDVLGRRARRLLGGSSRGR